MNQTENNQADALSKIPGKSWGYKKMLWLLFLFGGPVGGLAFSLLISVLSVFEDGASIPESWESPLFYVWFVLLGWPMGVGSALLTGIVAAMFGLSKGLCGSVLMTLAGAVVSLVYGAIMVGLQNSIFMYTPSGALSALLFSIWLPHSGDGNMKKGPA